MERNSVDYDTDTDAADTGIGNDADGILTASTVSKNASSIITGTQPVILAVLQSCSWSLLHYLILEALRPPGVRTDRISTRPLPE